jgi:hypothetical protein
LKNSANSFFSLFLVAINEFLLIVMPAILDGGWRMEGGGVTYNFESVATKGRFSSNFLSKRF